MQGNKHLLHFGSTEFCKFQSLDISFGLPVEACAMVHRTPLTDRIDCRIAQAIDRTLRSGVLAFRREIMLPRLIPVGPGEIADGSEAGRRRVVQRLAKALRGERTRGRAGHWTYSLNRHIGLLQAFRAERAALRSLGPSSIDCRSGLAGSASRGQLHLRRST